ncbi:MAG: SAM-dependent methyltransferase [Candidatus Eremiobacterota bacterium]
MVGFGPGSWGKLTLEVQDLLLGADRILMRDPASWEVARELQKRGKRLISLSSLYLLGFPMDDMYPLMADVVVQSARRYGPLVYALPGNPMVFEFSTLMLRRRAREFGLSCTLVEGMSCLETLFVSHNIDPGLGLQVLNFVHFDEKPQLLPDLPVLMFQVGAPACVFPPAQPWRPNLLRLKDHLLACGYPPTQPAFLLKPGPQGQISVEGRVSHLEQLEEYLNSTSTLYLPPRWLYTR